MWPPRSYPFLTRTVSHVSSRPAVVVCEPGLVVPVLVGNSRTVAVVEFEHYPRVRHAACVDVLERPRGTVVGGVPEVCGLVVVVGNPAQVAAVYRYRCPAPDVVEAVDHLPSPIGSVPGGELKVVGGLVPVGYPWVVAAVKRYRVELPVVVGVVEPSGSGPPMRCRCGRCSEGCRSCGRSMRCGGCRCCLCPGRCEAWGCSGP